MTSRHAARRVVAGVVSEAGPMVSLVFGLQALRDRRYAQAIASHVELEAARLDRATAPMQVGLESPFPHVSELQAVVWADLTGQDFRPITRAAAMAIPAVARQRHIIAGTVARLPLVALAGAAPMPTQPLWTTRGDGPLSPYHRMLWTIDDLIFHGWSLWSATRGVAEAGMRPLLGADRIPMERWEVDEVGRIKVDGEYVATGDEVILIPGPHEGILNFGAAALRRMVDNLEAAANAARNPSAYLELHYTGEVPMTDTEVDKLIERWAKARRGENGGVSFTGRSLEVKEHGTHEAHLLIEGRNADAVDASRLVSSPAAMADATNAGASLTYETTSGRNQQLIDYGVGLYMDSVSARLSMDDVVTRGNRVAFDTAQLTVVTPATTGAPTND